MALTKQFANALDNLWDRRTAELRALVIPRKAGQQLKFSRQVRERYINYLLDTATEVLLKRDGRSQFRSIVRQRQRRRIKGRGLLDRGRDLLRWARTHVKGPIIYAFWRGKKCLYVGKGASWKRLRAYEKSAYLRSRNSISVYRVSRSQLGKAECLATHLYEPRDQRVKPARVKWGKACPICRKHDHIRHELNTLFRMK